MNNIANVSDRKDGWKKKGLNYFLPFVFLFFVLIFVSQLPVSFAEEFQKAKSETLANFDLDSQLGIIPKWELTKIDNGNAKIDNGNNSNTNTNGQPTLAEVYPLSPAVEQRLLNNDSPIEINSASTGVMAVATGDGSYSIPGGIGITNDPSILQNASAMMMQGGGGGAGVSGGSGLTVGGPEIINVVQAAVSGGGGSSAASEPPLVEHNRKG